MLTEVPRQCHHPLRSNVGCLEERLSVLKEGRYNSSIIESSRTYVILALTNTSLELHFKKINQHPRPQLDIRLINSSSHVICPSYVYQYEPSIRCPLQLMFCPLEFKKWLFGSRQVQVQIVGAEFAGKSTLLYTLKNSGGAPKATPNPSTDYNRELIEYPIGWEFDIVEVWGE